MCSKPLGQTEFKAPSNPSSLAKPSVVTPWQGERVFPKMLVGQDPSHSASAFEKSAWKSCLLAVFWLLLAVTGCVWLCLAPCHPQAERIAPTCAPSDCRWTTNAKKITCRQNVCRAGATLSGEEDVSINKEETLLNRLGNCKIAEKGRLPQGIERS